MLHVTIENKGDAVHLALSGRMDGGPSCESLIGTVKSRIESGERRFVFDLEELVSMSSRGIGCLVSSYASIHTAGGSMTLLSPNDRVLHVLEVTRLVPSVFDVVFARDETASTSPDPDTRSGIHEGQGTASG